MENGGWLDSLEFQSRKQDYFNWKQKNNGQDFEIVDIEFQSRKQDYFNWKPFWKA